MRIIEPGPSWSPYPMGSLSKERALPSFEKRQRFGVDELPALPLHNARCVPITLEMASTELHHEVSDGIPITIGADESTTPKTPPKGSTLIETDDGALTGRVRSSGVRW